MFIDVIAMHMVKMAVVQVVHVIPMPDGSMAAVGTMDMRMVAVLRMCARRHASAP
jgi:hypothetical protein